MLLSFLSFSLLDMSQNRSFVESIKSSTLNCHTSTASIQHSSLHHFIHFPPSPHHPNIQSSPAIPARADTAPFDFPPAAPPLASEAEAEAAASLAVPEAEVSLAEVALSVADPVSPATSEEVAELPPSAPPVAVPPTSPVTVAHPAVDPACTNPSSAALTLTPPTSASGPPTCSS